MNRDAYAELRAARADHAQQWNYGGAAGQALARARLDAAERRVRELEAGKPRRAPIAWPAK